MAKETIDEKLTKWPYEPSMLETRNELLERYRHMHQRAELEAAELRAELTNVRRGLGDLNSLVQTAQGQRESLEDLARRARGIIRSMHLQLKPRHAKKLHHGDPSFKVGDKNHLIEAWCPTCAVLLEMETGGNR